MKQLSMYDQDFDLLYQEKPCQDAHQERNNLGSNNCRYLQIHPDKHTKNREESSHTNPAEALPSSIPNVTEIVLTRDKVDSIQLILPMLINLHQEKRWLAWIDPPIQLLREWQKAHNEKALNQIMILRSSDSFSVFELSKRALEAGTCHAVIAWTNTLSQDEFTSLEDASAYGNSHGIILRSRALQ